MKGLLFYDQDCGRGGEGGYLAHYQTWCVEIDGKKMHIHSELTGDPCFPPERGGPTRSISVKPCDASCTKLVEIDEQIARKALVQITAEDRSLTSQEVEELPSELAGTTYLSELVENYRRMMKERDQERRKAHAGYNLFSSIKYSSLFRWFLKGEISRYEEATR